MKKLIVGIILFVIVIGLVIYHEININSQYQTNLHDITNSGSKTENIKVYLDATYVAGTIKNDDYNSFYVVFGDGVQYLVYMNNKLANKIDKYLLDNPDSSYRIIGITKKIPEELESNGKKFVKKWLDANHSHEHEIEEDSHDITTDEFYQYFGYVYMDNNLDNSLILIAYITGLISLLLILSVIVKKYHLL